jgi:hypothetical protein
MYNLKVLRVLAVTLAAGMLGSCGEMLNCIEPQCVADQIYHGSTPEKPIHVEKVNMYVGAYGWGAFKLSLPPTKLPPAPHPVSFDKAYLEVKEDGLLFDKRQLEVILERIGHLKNPKRPIFVFTYAHGWHHNASTPHVKSEEEGLGYNAIKFDYFMARFAEHVRRLYELNGDDNSPLTLGIYIGWRGKSTTDPLANIINVGNRADTADVIGLKRGEDSLFDALDKISTKLRDTGPSSRMIASGHSLGGRMMSRMFLEELAAGRPQPLGPQTLIAAIEPAISAACFDSVFKTASAGRPSGDLPSFIAITSKDDIAVVDGFRLGHLLPSLDPARCDDKSAARNTALGVYAPYVTHIWHFEPDPKNATLEKTGCNPPKLGRDPDWLFKKGTSLWTYPYLDHSLEAPCPNKGGNYSSDAMVYRLKVEYPESGYQSPGAVWNVKTDKNLIYAAGDTGTNIGDQHNGFSSTGLADMLGRIAYAQVRWQAEGAGTRVPEPKAKP